MSFRRRNRGNAIRPVNRIKHVIDIQAGVTLGTTFVSSLIQAVDSTSLANTNEVETGAIVNGIYLKVEVQATTEAALPNVYMSIFKNPGGNLTAPAPNAVGPSDNKKYVIHQEMVMMSKSVNPNPRTLFNGVVVLPRGYRRFGPGDSLQIQIRPPGVNIDLCIQCHYKEFR